MFLIIVFFMVIMVTNVQVDKIKYDEIGNFSEDFAYVRLNDQWGFINTKGEEVIPLKYDNAGDFKEGLALVKLNNK